MTRQTFDYNAADAQATPVEPVSPESFDFKAYEDYESSLLEKCSSFRNAESGVMVYRRMRVGEVYAGGCRDMRRSLELQLGALKKSILFKADIPNFIEPWYGIGTVASAFGIEYTWKENLAPAVKPPFRSVKDALDYPAVPVAGTPIGKHTVEMIDYFLDRTGGRLPMSSTDSQSPLNISTYIVDISSFFMEMFDNPEGVKTLLDRVADLYIDFSHKQIELIGEALVLPGHGFASCRCFEGMGFSDDNMLMLSGKHYLEFATPALEKAGRDFGGIAFHSCGDWSDRIDTVKKIAGLHRIDGAFSPATDPSPNPPEPFSEAFVNTHIVVDARIVGDPDDVAGVVKHLWKPGMKLVVVTYCQTPEEQAVAYERIHEICRI
ncbi:uroporphyrinogen decarboxylase family protein [Candidatus Latescibacterota bacterium]